MSTSNHLNISMSEHLNISTTPKHLNSSTSKHLNTRTSAPENLLTYTTLWSSPVPPLHCPPLPISHSHITLLMTTLDDPPTTDLPCVAPLTVPVLHYSLYLCLKVTALLSAPVSHYCLYLSRHCSCTTDFSCAELLSVPVSLHCLYLCCTTY